MMSLHDDDDVGDDVDDVEMTLELGKPESSSDSRRKLWTQS